MGEETAYYLDQLMRNKAWENESRNEAQCFGEQKQNLCPGCYMTVMYNATLTLAERNGQDVHELAATMAKTFKELAKGKFGHREYVTVIRHTFFWEDIAGSWYPLAAAEAGLML